MAEIVLDRDARLELRSQAHHLDPVVLLGANGLTEAVIKEVDRALDAHELIKIRVPGDDREERDEMFLELIAKLDAVDPDGRMRILSQNPRYAADNPAEPKQKHNYIER